MQTCISDLYHQKYCLRFGCTYRRDLFTDFMFMNYSLICWLGLLTCKNCLPYNLYCVGGDVKHCSINQSIQSDQYAILIRAWCELWCCMLLYVWYFPMCVWSKWSHWY